MSDKPKILAFAGSTREDSFNKKLIRIAVGKAVKAGGEVTLIDLRDYPMPLYDGDLEDKEGLPENAVKLRELFLQHDGLLISSPEYNSAFSGVLKNALDWVSRPEPGEKPLHLFRGKTAALMGASPSKRGGKRSIAALKLMLSNIMVKVIDDEVHLPFADKAFDEDGSLKSSEKEKELESLANKLVEAMKNR